MPDLLLPLGARSLPVVVADVVRDTRRLAGWSQRELARRSGVPQAVICRIENARAPVLDVGVVERLLGAMGMRASLAVDGRHLVDRRRQGDGVHACCNGYLARRFGRAGWATATEVEIGDGTPVGWIDLLAYRASDRSLVVDETKADLPDVGAFQRSLAFHERRAREAANRLGWRPTRVVVLAAMLDSGTIARRLVANRDLVTQAFPSPVERMAAWVRDPAAPAPFGPTLATIDPAARGATWLRPTTLGSRRRPPAYADYADAAARLRRNR